MKLSLLARFEQILRTMCMFCFLFAAITCFLALQLVLPVFTFIDKLTNHYFTRDRKLAPMNVYMQKYFELGMFKLLGIEYIIENRSKTPIDSRENAIVMFTHGSNLDPPLLHLIFPNYLHFIGKKSLFKIPLLGRVLKILGQIPIDRSNLQAAIETLKAAGQLARVEKKSIAVAPEGTRRRSNSTGPDQLLPFKKGPFHLAKSAGIDVIPAVIIGANRLWPAGSMMPAPGIIVVRFCERITKEEIAKMSIEQIQTRLKSIYEDNLTPVDNRVIYNTDRKPYLMFVATLLGMTMTLTLIIRFFIFQNNTQII